MTNSSPFINIINLFNQHVYLNIYFMSFPCINRKFKKKEEDVEDDKDRAVEYLIYLSVTQP